MLSGGEFVMNRSAVQSIGAPNLQSMNAGGTSITSEETSKELNEKLLAKLDELIGCIWLNWKHHHQRGSIWSNLSRNFARSICKPSTTCSSNQRLQYCRSSTTRKELEAL
jgi:hypothetical protein